MASIKLKFRPSTIKGEPGALYYRVIHNRIARQVTTQYRIYSDEWDESQSSICVPDITTLRIEYLSKISSGIDEDLRRFSRVVNSLEQKKRPYTADDVISAFLDTGYTLFEFMSVVIESLKQLGKIRTAETYISTLNSFKRFRKDKDIALDDINSNVIMLYESHLRSHGVSPNSSSFYMRILRAVYNRAVDKELTVQHFPFKHVYTGVNKTVKRALPLRIIKQIKDMDLSLSPTLDFARDMFMFAFYTRGMSFVDMAYLKKADLRNGILSYRRSKTGQQLFIKWEKCMQNIVEKYEILESPYMLPIIKPNHLYEERKQYIYAAHNINKYLKRIGKKLNVTIPLTMYVSRHSWASIAKSKNIPISVISEGMGHDSEATTRIYLASLDNMAIDKANNLILKSL